MKKTLLLVLTLCFTFGLNAQDISVTPDPVTKHLTVDEGDVKVDFNLVNNTTRDAEVWWEFDRGNVPAEWGLFLCDANLCYTASVTSCPCNNPNLLPGSTETVFQMHVENNGVMGTGTFTIKILESCNGTETVTEIPVTFVVTETTSTGFQDINNKIKLYPNPSSQLLNIKEDAEVSDIIIYNLIGKKIKTLKHSVGESHDISELDRGIYLIRMLNKEQHILNVSRLTKK